MSNSKKPKRGRPIGTGKSPSLVLSRRINVRFTADEDHRILSASGGKGERGKWLRRVAIEALDNGYKDGAK